MSTRGGIGYVVGDSVIKFVYQHFDSYPSGLGGSLLAEYHRLGGNIVELRRSAVDDHAAGWSSYPEKPYDDGDGDMTGECQCPAGDYTHCDALFIEWLYVLNASGLDVYKSAPTGQVESKTGPHGSWESPLYRHLFVGTLSWDADSEAVAAMEDRGGEVAEAEWEKHGRSTVL